EGHSWCEFPKMSGLHKNKLIDKILNSRTFECDGYMHFYIYPNAFISSVEGKGFYFGFIIPQTASQTVLRIRYFSPIIEKKLTESEKNIFDFINKSSLDTLELVLNEDKQIIENIQSNLNSLPSNSPMFGLDEFRINNFHNFFSKKLNL